MATDLGPSLVKTLPQFIVIAVAGVLAIIYRRGLGEWLRTVTHVRVGRFELQRAIAELTEAVPEDRAVPSEIETRRAVERLAAAKPRMGIDVLWVDDHPEGNKQLRQFLAKYGPRFTLATSNAAARLELGRKDYALVISDIARDHEDEDGLQLARELLRRADHVPVVLFVGDLADVDVPPRLAGITNDSAELVHLVIDVAERRD